MTGRLPLLTPCVFAMLAAIPAAAADDAPAWLKELSAVSLPQYGAKVTTVVLLNEEHTTIDNNGKLSTTTRTAVKFLARQGADVMFYEQYDTASGKVRDFNAWMIAGSGKVKKYGKEEILDVACANNDVYNECRRRAVSGKRDTEPGSVFGYESTVESQSFSNQLIFHFQDGAPVRLARFQVTIPAGWEIKATAFNGAPREAVAAGSTYSWQMENLQPLEPETAAPGFLSLVPWVGVNLLGGAARKPVLSWSDAALQLAQLNEGQAEPSAAITAKAKALTEGAATEMDKIRALGKFAQQVNYVSVQVNIAKGGGYRPHPAAQVFEKLYGDCKDKANLMRTLLKAAGMTAYPVAIYSGDRTHVNPEWPSLGAFNHAISAIRVGPETQAPAVLDHPRLGRLLFFDPTDAYVEPGYLPDHEQASMALVAVGESGDLVKVPASAAAPEAHGREVDAVLKADGSIEGSFVEKRTGEALADAVAEYRAMARPDYLKAIERWLGRSVPGSVASGIEVQEGRSDFLLKGKFASRTFAQMPQTRMMIFRAGLLHHGEIRLTEKTRKYPIVLDNDAISETVKIALPPQFNVDELPDDVHEVSPFGKYEATWAVESGTLTFRRKIEVPAQTVPANQYNALKKFLDSAYGTGDLPVLLMK